MNIIYRLRELGTDEERYYVGSKVECTVNKMDGINTIFFIQNGRPYYGSSSNKVMQHKLKSGVKYEAEILEQVPRRADVIGRERWWITELGAVESDLYYNLAYPTADPSERRLKSGAVVNIFGETRAELAGNNSSFGRRDATAQELGFDNFGELYYYIIDERLAGKTTIEVAGQVGKKRLFVERTVKRFDSDRALKQRETLLHDEALKEQVRDFICKGASLVYIARELELEEPFLRLLQGKFNTKGERGWQVAHNQGKTQKELEEEVTRRVLNEESYSQIARDLAINSCSIKRYFIRCVKRNIDLDNLV